MAKKKKASPARPIFTLTKNDQLFVDEYFNNGFNATGAYRKVFNPPNPLSAKWLAYNLLANVNVKNEVEKRYKEIQEVNVIRRQDIMIELKELLTNAIEKNDSTLILKTIDTIAKMSGYYTTIIDATVKGTINLTIPGLDIKEDETSEEQ